MRTSWSVVAALAQQASGCFWVQRARVMLPVGVQLSLLFWRSAGVHAVAGHAPLSTLQ